MASENTTASPLAIGDCPRPGPHLSKPTQVENPVVIASELTKVFGSSPNAVTALDHVDISIEAGRLTAIMGPSGSGKSTLMHCLAGLETATSGKIFIGDIEVSALPQRKLTQLRRDHIGFIFQSYNLVPTLTAAENIVLPLTIARRKPDKQLLEAIIEAVDLRDRLHHHPAELSGGQQQRVAVARALISEPAVIFADEPTGNLDSNSTNQVLSYLRQTVDEFGQTVVMVTHEPDAAAYADRVLFLQDGQVIAQLDHPDYESVLTTVRQLSGGTSQMLPAASDRATSAALSKRVPSWTPRSSQLHTHAQPPQPVFSATSDYASSEPIQPSPQYGQVASAVVASAPKQQSARTPLREKVASTPVTLPEKPIETSLVAGLPALGGAQPLATSVQTPPVKAHVTPARTGTRFPRVARANAAQLRQQTAPTTVTSAGAPVATPRPVSIPTPAPTPSLAPAPTRAPAPAQNRSVQAPTSLGAASRPAPAPEPNTSPAWPLPDWRQYLSTSPNSQASSSTQASPARDRRIELRSPSGGARQVIRPGSGPVSASANGADSTAGAATFRSRSNVGNTSAPTSPHIPSPSTAVNTNATGIRAPEVSSRSQLSSQTQKVQELTAHAQKIRQLSEEQKALEEMRARHQRMSELLARGQKVLAESNSLLNEIDDAPATPRSATSHLQG